MTRVDEIADADAQKYPDESAGSIRLAGLVVRVAEEAVERGLVDVDPTAPLDYRRVLCLNDGSQVHIRMARLTRCASCERVHERTAAPCASDYPGTGA